MTDPEFDILIDRLETYATRAPRAYQVRVALLAYLGYAALFFVLLVLLMIAAGIVAVMALPQHPLLLLKLLIAPVALAATLIKSLNVSIPEPQGLEIKRQDAPDLFALLDHLGAELKSPQFHRVLLTREMNAAVAQVPRLGVLGWQRNFLLLGLPLMQALTLKQFTAVVAHEVAHLSGNHGRFSAWIYRVRLTWLQVLDNLHRDKQRRAAAWGRRFFEWYAPYFSAYSFVLARQQEYEADRHAAVIAGAPAMAQALALSRIRQSFCDDQFWPDVQKQTELVPEPPPVFTSLSAVLQGQIPADQAQRFFHQALLQETGTADTHPSLAHRLNALGYFSDLDQVLDQAVAEKSGNAATHFLGSSLPTLLGRLEAEWQQQVSARWHQRFKEIQEGKRVYAALNEKAQEQVLTPGEAWDQACLTREFGEAHLAAALFQQIAVDNPASADAKLALGQTLLQQNDPTGITLLEAAIEINPDMTLSACQSAVDFCRRQGRMEEAEKFRQKAVTRRRVVALAQAEREEVEKNVQFEAHDLSPAAVADLARQLTQFPSIKAAYLVKKKVKHLPEHPLYVLWLVPPIIAPSSPGTLVKQIAPRIKFSKQMHLFVTDATDLRLLKIRRTLKNAPIYRKGR